MNCFLRTWCVLAALASTVQAQPAAVRPLQPSTATSNGPKVTIVRYRMPATAPVATPPVATAPVATAPVATPPVATAPLATAPGPSTVATSMSVATSILECGQRMCASCGASGCMRPGLLARLGAWFCFRSHGCYPAPSRTPNCTPPLSAYFVRDCGVRSYDQSSGAVNPPYRRSVFPVGHFMGAQPTGMPGGGLGTVPSCCSR
ncbi:MAG: hypothetical protein SNJ75_17875 [Gemmataceae bacterium]